MGAPMSLSGPPEIGDRAGRSIVEGTADAIRRKTDIDGTYNELRIMVLPRNSGTRWEGNSMRWQGVSSSRPNVSCGSIAALRDPPVNDRFGRYSDMGFRSPDGPILAEHRNTDTLNDVGFTSNTGHSDAPMHQQAYEKTPASWSKPASCCTVEARQQARSAVTPIG